MNKKIHYHEEELADNSIFKDSGKFVSINGAKIYIVEKGTGENIIFINGIAASIYTWRKVLDKLANNFHVYGIDFLGTGLSEKPKIEYSIKLYTKQILDFMDYYNMKSAFLVGNSLGGEIALNFTIMHAERVKKLILIDSAGYQKNKEITGFLVKLSRFKLTSKILKFISSRKFIKKIIEGAIYNDKIINKEMIEGYYKPMKTKGGVEAFISLVKNLSYTEFNYEDVKLINVPTLIIWGRNDRWIPISDAYEFQKDIKNSKLVVLENCGHGPQEEKPDEVVELINSFIK